MGILEYEKFYFDYDHSEKRGSTRRRHTIRAKLQYLHWCLIYMYIVK